MQVEHNGSRAESLGIPVHGIDVETRGTITAVVSSQFPAQTSERRRSATRDNGQSEGVEVAPYPQWSFVVKMKGRPTRSVEPRNRPDEAGGTPSARLDRVQGRSDDAAPSGATDSRVESRPRRKGNQKPSANSQTTGASVQQAGTLEDGLSRRLLRFERPSKEWPWTHSHLRRDGRLACPDVVPGDV